MHDVSPWSSFFVGIERPGVGELSLNLGDVKG
jgi:hypothetical protein